MQLGWDTTYVELSLIFNVIKMVLKYIITVMCAFFSLQTWCMAQKAIDKKAQKVIRECVAAHGGKHYQNFDISFDFRKYKVSIWVKNADFKYERTTQDSSKNDILDVLNNAGFVREINGVKQILSAKEEDRYREGLNSIAYFALLPFKLTDPAVNLAHIGTIKIDDQKYDKIKVWFNAEGGGKDHEDVFCYWINQKTHTLDYLSYANGGPRFRKATKRATVSGIVFQDYENYEILDKTIRTDEYDKAFMQGKAKLLSKIEQVNYKANQ